MARILDFDEADGTQRKTANLTEYVVSRWWRAPEVMLADGYSLALDVWSCGSILAEMLLRKPLFRGNDYADQLVKIINLIGSPSEEEVAQIPDEGARMFIRYLGHRNPVGWDVLMPKSSPEQRQALDAMLAFDPAKRLSVDEVLHLPLFEGEWVPEDEPVAEPMRFDWAESSVETVADAERLLEKELEAAAQLRKVRIHQKVTL